MYNENWKFIRSTRNLIEATLPIVQWQEFMIWVANLEVAVGFRRAT